MRGPDPRERDLVKLEDMRMHAERARRFLGSRTFDEFQADELVQNAVIRCLEVVGEAARQVSEATHYRVPEIPWPLIIGLRNVLAHDYGAVDLERVYRVVCVDLLELLKQIEKLIAALELEVDWSDDDEKK